MNCPVCGMEVNGNQFCPACGANMAAFEGVAQDKVIINQTPEQQIAAGDDSVTQLIPENYMTATGDDSVTQLIPENYMTAKGDDEATIMLDPSQAPQYMPNQQPTFAQAPTAQPMFAQAPGMVAPQGMPMQGGYQQPQQPYGQPQQVYQRSFGGTKKAPTASKGVAIGSLALMAVMLLCFVIFITKPLFYICQSYIGGVYSDEILEDEIVGMDEDDYEDANNSARLLFGAATVMVLIGALNAWSCFARIKYNCVKSPVNKAVGNFVFGLLGVIIFVVIKSMLDEIVTDGISYGMYSPEEASMFNIYSIITILGIVSVVVNLINIFAASAAKKATR